MGKSGSHVASRRAVKTTSRTLSISNHAQGELIRYVILILELLGKKFNNRLLQKVEVLELESVYLQKFTIVT